MKRGKPGSVIVHSDQGSTYASTDYQKLLKSHDLVCSMSRKGERLDNAVAESFFGTLKTELVDDEDYRTQEEACSSRLRFFTTGKDDIPIWAISARWNSRQDMPHN